MSAEIEIRLADARRLLAEGRLLEAERLFLSLTTPGGAQRSDAFEALADLYLHEDRLDEACIVIKALTKEDPVSLQYCAQLAKLLNRLGRTQAAIVEYLRLIKLRPNLAVAYYEIALLYTQIKQFSAALGAYEDAVRLNIDSVEKVYSNMGVLYSEINDAEQAKQMYEQALDVAPDYVPALYNLAGHFEEIDRKRQAIECYERILTINPAQWQALARLAYPQRITSENQGVVSRLENAIEDRKDDDLAREALYFALGKAFDDLKLYDKASDAFVAANKLGKVRAAPYDKVRTEGSFDQLIDLFDADWLKHSRSESQAAPIFICGMLRSGSTLLEQMIAAHPRVTAGGEIAFFPWLLGRDLAPYPQGARDASRQTLRRVGDDYLARVRKLFPGFEIITDKRPDNFLHIGLIKALFPAARIVLTRRNMLDNCLSIYFQQLGRALNYATDVQNVAHYYHQQERLVAHWMDFLGKEIFVVDYEELVKSPEPIMRRLTNYLELEWDPRILQFQESSRIVKTASLWQVREELHTRSSGRWRNYEGLIQKVQMKLTGCC